MDAYTRGFEGEKFSLPVDVNKTPEEQKRLANDLIEKDRWTKVLLSIREFPDIDLNKFLEKVWDIYGNDIHHVVQYLGDLKLQGRKIDINIVKKLESVEDSFVIQKCKLAMEAFTDDAQAYLNNL